MPGGVKVFGPFWCPRCMQNQYFYGFGEQGDSRVHAANDAECRECSYTFGRKTDPETGEVRGVLSPEMTAAADAAMRRDHEKQLIERGIDPRGMTRAKSANQR